MAKQIIIKTNCIVLQETKDNNIVSAQGFNKGGLSYRIDNNCIKFYLVDDYFYKNVVWTAGFPLQVGDAYYTAETIADALKDLFIRPIETLTVDTQLDSGSTNPVTNSATAQAIDEINEKFPDYYLKTEVDALLDTKADASSIPTDYYDRDQTDALLANKADKSEIPSLNGYATEYWVQHQGYLTQHQSLAGLATEDWVLAKHYLTEHQSLDDYYNKQETITLLSTKMDKQAFSGLATIDYVDQEIEDVERELSGKANKSWVESQGYLTEHQPLKTINHNIISGYGNIDISVDTSDFYTKTETDNLLDEKQDLSGMSGYTTKQYVDDGLAGKADRTDLNDFYNKNQVDFEIEQAVSGKVDASTLEDYYLKTEVDNLLGEKVNVSSMTDYYTSAQTDSAITSATQGLASEQYVDSAVSGKADASTLEDYYTKTESNTLLAGKQDELSAGTGIDITDNVISVTLDTNLFIVVQELPQVGVENKIYLVPSENTGVSNVYVEYIYENGEWEELGEEQIEVDLSDYYDKTETDTLLGGKQDVSGMTVYALKTEIPTVPTNVSAFNNDAGYLTSHTPLKTVNNNVISGTGNVTIDAASLGVYTSGETDTKISNAVSGLASEHYVDSAVSGKADSSDLANYALKSELPTIDSAITSGGTNAVEGSAIYTALAAKVSFTDVDSTLNSGSTNPISNQAVYNAIGNVEALLATI